MLSMLCDDVIKQTEQRGVAVDDQQLAELNDFIALGERKRKKLNKVIRKARNLRKVILQRRELTDTVVYDSGSDQRNGSES